MANLILPFESMRELYNRSHGEPEDLANASVDDVTAWWSAGVFGLLILSAMVAKFIFDRGTNAVVMTPLWTESVILSFAVLLLPGSAVPFAKLVRTITRAQSDLLPQLGFPEVRFAPNIVRRCASSVERVAVLTD